MDHKVIIVRQDRFVLSTSQSRLMKVPVQEETSSSNKRDAVEPIFPLTNQSEVEPNMEQDDSSDEEEEPMGELEEDRGVENVDDLLDADIEAQADDSSDRSESDSSLDRSQLSTAESETAADTSASELNESLDVNEKHLKEVIEARKLMMENPKILPKKSQKIVMRRLDVKDDDWRVVIVDGRGNKVKNKKGPYMNVTDRDGNAFGIYLDRSEWHFISDVPKQFDSIQNYVDESDDEDDDLEDAHLYPSLVVYVPTNMWNHPNVLRAMQKEIQNFRNFKAFELVDDVGQHAISSGNQEEFPARTDSPTVKKSSIVSGKAGMFRMNVCKFAQPLFNPNPVTRLLDQSKPSSKHRHSCRVC